MCPAAGKIFFWILGTAFTLIFKSFLLAIGIVEAHFLVDYVVVSIYSIIGRNVNLVAFFAFVDVAISHIRMLVKMIKWF